MKQLFLFILLLSTAALSAQTNIICTNPAADQVLKGQYNPVTYKASTVLNRPDTISRGIRKRLSPDSLKSSILQIASYRNHNTGSDTVSAINGIGAARRWVFSKFQQYSTLNQNRLLPAYLQFNQAICGIPQHREFLPCCRAWTQATNPLSSSKGISTVAVKAFAIPSARQGVWKTMPAVPHLFLNWLAS